MHLDVKETIWHRLVIDESYEAEVTKMLYEGKSYADVADFLESKGENIGVEYLFDTTQGIEPEQNDGENTIELIDNDNNIVWGNNGDNKFILNPDEKTVGKILRACWRNDRFCPCSPGASDVSQKKMKRKVVFHRHYEVDNSQCIKYLADRDYQYTEMTPELMDEAAIDIARNWMADEMSEFLDNIEDFVSATVEREEEL